MNDTDYGLKPDPYEELYVTLGIGPRHDKAGIDAIRRVIEGSDLKVIGTRLGQPCNCAPGDPAKMREALEEIGYTTCTGQEAGRIARNTLAAI